MAHYRLEVEPDDNGTFVVTCPALPEVTTFGDTEAEAIRMGELAIQEALAARLNSGADVPAFSSNGEPPLAFVPTLAALKVALHRLLKEQGLTRAELGRRLGWHREQVDRLFRLDHASKTDQLDAAFAALGHRVTVFPVIIADAA